MNNMPKTFDLDVVRLLRAVAKVLNTDIFDERVLSKTFYQLLFILGAEAKDKGIDLWKRQKEDKVILDKDMEELFEKFVRGA